MWSRFFSQRRRAVRPSLASRKLKLEQLEDRLTPAPAPFAASVGGLLPDSGQSVATDVAGNVYVAGNRGGTLSDIDTDAYVAKYLNDGTPQWSRVFQGLDELGNSFGDSANAITVDAAGNSYVAGTFRATMDFGNGIVLTSTGPIDGFVAKLDPNGAVTWAHQFANVGNFGPYLYDRLGTRAPKGIAIDHAQNPNVLVTGFFSGHIDLDPIAHPGQHVLDTSNGPNDNASGYVVKLDSDGNFVWDAQADGVGGASAFSIAVDGLNNVYTLGGTGDHAYFKDKNANSLPLFDDSNHDVLYVWKLTANGLNARVTQLETSADNQGIFGLGIAVDAAANTYVTGAFSGTGFDFDLGVSQMDDTISSDGGHDVFIAKLDNFGHYQWVHKAGGVGDDWGTGIALDKLGHPYVTGYVTADSLFGNQLLTPVSPDGNSFVTELDADGNFLCTHKSEDTGFLNAGDKAAAIAVDGQGFVDIAGAYTRTMKFGDLPGLIYVGSTDLFVVKTKLECSSIQMTLLDGGHLVQLLGTNQGDHVRITNALQLGLLVTLDNEAPRVLGFGVTAIEGQMGGGDDLVDLQFHSRGLSEAPRLPMPDVRFDLGIGANQFTLEAAVGPEFMPSGPQWRIDLNSGNGNDMAHTDVTGSVPVLMTANTGGGRDLSIYEFHDIEELPAPTEVSYNGGPGGGDDVRVIYGFNPMPEPPGVVGMPITVNVDVQGGGNRIDVEYGIDAISGIPPGDTPLVLNIPVTTNIHSGGGADDVRVTHGFNPMPEPPGFPGVVVTAPITDVIDSGGGNNSIIVTLNSLPAGPGDPMTRILAPVTVMARSGAGADSVLIGLHNVAFNGTGNVAVDTGGGGDEVGFVIEGCRVAGVMSTSFRLGAGNDRMAWSNHDVDVSGQFTVSVSGNGGDDWIQADLQPKVEAGGQYTVLFSGDDGDDRIDVETRNLLLTGAAAGALPTAFRLMVGGGDGSDQIRVRTVAPIFDGAAVLSTIVDGGTGNDFIDVAFTDPTGDLYGADRAQAIIRVTGGDGRDEIHLLLGSIHQPPDPELRLDWDVMVSGDAGNDLIDVEARNVLLTPSANGLASGRFRLVADGGDNNDTIAVNLSFAPQSLGMVEAMVLGSGGNDDLTLDVGGAGGFPVFFPVFATIDGGDGFDTAHHTANVRVVNCER